MRISLLVAALWFVPSLAFADRLEVVGGDEGQTTETAHTIDVTVEPGLAVLRVDREFTYTGKQTADIGLFVGLPQGGVVTNVRIHGSGEVEAQADGVDALLFFPKVKGKSKRSVSYRVEVPLVSVDGFATIWLPQADTSEGLIVPVVRLGGEVLLAEDNPVWDPVRVPLPSPAEGRAHWGAIQVSRGWVWRVEVDAPHELGKAVAHANIVFLLDVSRSQGRKGIDRQLALLQEWSRRMPRARYQVIAYHRQADLVFPTWKSTDGVRDLGPGHAKLVPQNGSDLGAALDLAASVLRGETGPAFVVVGTDGEVAVAAAPEALSARLDGLDRKMVVHLVVTSGRHTRGAIETRADWHRLAPIALDHGGVPVSVYLPDDWPDPPEALALQNLLQTTRIDRFDTTVDGKAYVGAEASQRLYARQGAVAMGRASGEPNKVGPSGLAWGRAWSIPAERNTAVDRRAGLFASLDLRDADALDEADVEALGHRLQFVTAKTALRVTESRSEVVAPRDTGLPRVSRGFGVGRGGGGGGQAAPPGELPEAQLATLFGAMFRPCVDSYRGPASSVQVSIEMSWNEILDVAAVGDDDTTARCIEESIWAADLADDFKDPHAFGMIEVPLQATTAVDQDDGPPETAASRAGGCAVDGRPTHAPGWAWLIGLCIPALARRRRNV